MATLIVLSTPRDGGEEAMRSYVDRVVPMLIEAGGVPVKRLRVNEVIAGDLDPGFVFVADFGDADEIREVFASDGYQALIPLRDQAFSTIEIFVTEDN